MRSTLAVLLLAVTATAGCSDPASSNHPPIAADDLGTTAEDAPIILDVLANDTDPDGDVLTFDNPRADGHIVANDDGRLRLTPAADFHGEIVVDFDVDDGEDTVPGRAVVTVTPVNDAPVAEAISVATARNTALAIVLAATDVDGDEVTFELVDEPAHGDLEGTPPALTYTPAADFIGADALTFRVRDADSTSATATVEIDVVAGQAPVADGISVATSEDVAAPITLTGTDGDGDGDALTFAIVTPPVHGTLTGTGAELTYTPAANFHGNDSVWFTVSDGVLTSAPGQVALSVSAVNDAPQAIGFAVATTEDAGVNFLLAGVDVDGAYDTSSLTYAIATPPSHGTLIGTGASLQYVPALDRNGVDTFTFTVSDATTTSAPAMVSIAVAAAPDAPVAVAQAVGATEDQPRAITLTGTDADGDTLELAVITAPAHGTLSGTAPSLSYTPAANYHGADAFDFVVTDGTHISAAGTIAITVAPVDDPPVAQSGTITTAEDQGVAFTLQGSDVDGDPLTYSVLVLPAHGAVTGSGASRTYTPALDTHGSDSLVYQVSDAHSAVTGTVTFAVTSVNDVPIARDDIAIAVPGAALTIGAIDNDEDADGDELAIEIASEPAHGAATVAGDDLVYTPAAGFTGSDAFTYTIADAAGAFATATVRVGTGQFPAGVPSEWIARSVSTSTVAQHDLSADGRYLAFMTSAPLVPGDTNGMIDVFVMDRLDGGLELVSVSSAGVQANGPSDRPSISADGRHVAFGAAASNLVAGDTNGVHDVFVHDRVTGVTIRASVGPGGAQGTGPSQKPDLSANGLVVAFTSSAFELVANDANGASDIFVRDLEAGVTTRMSVTSTGGEADALSVTPAISGDGRVVAFTSSATNLVAGDGNGVTDVFVHDRVSGATERISVTSTGGESNLGSKDATLSDDGRFVSFLSAATNLTGAATHAGNKAFVRDRQATTTTWAVNFTSATVPMRSAQLSGDGRYITGFVENGASIIRDRFSGAVHAISVWDGIDAFYPVLSGNGRYVAILSAGALVPLPPTATGTQVFVVPNPL